MSPEIADPEDAVSFEIKGGIEFDFFLLPDGQRALEAFLKIEAGKVWDHRKNWCGRQRLHWLPHHNIEEKRSSTASI